MGSYTVFVALTWMVTTVLLCLEAAPVTEFFGPPQTIEGDSNVEYPDSDDNHNKVEEMERFHRTYKNGTVEFKMALSNGHVQYQRISTKLVDGDKVQVFEGYTSEQYKDGRYGTRYYAADENGYRSSSVIIENKPPKLPTGGPYRSSLPENIQNELSPSNADENLEIKSKTLIDNLLQIENYIEDEQLLNLNPGFNNLNEISIGTTESKILKHQEKDILDNTHSDEPSVLQNFGGDQTDLPINLDLPSSTEFLYTSKFENNYGKISAEPESSTLGAIHVSEEERNVAPSTSSENLAEKDEDVTISNEEPVDSLPSDVNTEQPIEDIQEATTGNPLNSGVSSTEQSAILNNEVQEEITEVTEELAGRSLNLLNNSELLAQNDKDGKIRNEEPIELELKTEQPIEVIQDATTTGNLLNDEFTSTESASLNNEAQEPSSEVKEELFGRNLSPLTNSEMLAKNDDDFKVLNEYPIDLEVKTEQSIDEIQEATTENILSDHFLSTEPSSSFNNKAQEPSSGLGEVEEVKTDDEASSVSEYPLEHFESTNLPTIDNISNVFTGEVITDIVREQSSTTENIASEKEFNVDNSRTSYDEGSEAKGRTFINNGVTATEDQASLNNEDEVSSTGVPEITEGKTDVETSSVDKIPEATPVTFLNDEVTLAEQPVTFNSEDEESNTSVPEQSELKTEGKTSSVAKYPLKNGENVLAEEELTKAPTEQPSLEIIEDISTETISSNNESNTDLSTSSFAPETQHTNTEINEFPTPSYFNDIKFELVTDFPLEDLTKTDDEASKEISNESQESNSSERDAKSFDFLKVLGLPENTTINTLSIETTLNNEDQDSSTGVPELTEVKADVDTSSVDEILEATTETFFNDVVKIVKKPASFNSEDQESITSVPEQSQVKADGETLSVAKYPLENGGSDLTTDNVSAEGELTKVSSEQPPLENIEDRSTETISSNNEPNTDLSTSSSAPETEHTNTEINEFSTPSYFNDIKFELVTDFPLENLTKTDDEASKEISNESQDSDSSEKDARSLNLLKVLGLSENNTTNIVKESGSEEGKHVSDDATITSTTDKTDISTEKSNSTEELSIATTDSNENINLEITTEDEVVVTTETNEASSTKKSEDNSTEKSIITFFKDLFD